MGDANDQMPPFVRSRPCTLKSRDSEAFLRGKKNNVLLWTGQHLEERIRVGKMGSGTILRGGGGGEVVKYCERAEALEGPELMPAFFSAFIGSSMTKP